MRYLRTRNWGDNDRSITTIWALRFTLTPAIARGLMHIEAARALVDHTPLSPAAEAELCSRARVHAAHFSTFTI